VVRHLVFANKRLVVIVASVNGVDGASRPRLTAFCFPIRARD
jgi:hypothetical protein